MLSYLDNLLVILYNTGCQSIFLVGILAIGRLSYWSNDSDPIQSTYNSVSGLHKLSNKLRPIRVKFNSVDEVLRIIKPKRQLYHIFEYKYLWITTDLTQYQKKYLTSLKKE